MPVWSASCAARSVPLGAIKERCRSILLQGNPNRTCCALERLPVSIAWIYEASCAIDKCSTAAGFGTYFRKLSIKPKLSRLCINKLYFVPGKRCFSGRGISYRGMVNYGMFVVFHLTKRFLAVLYRLPLNNV